VINRKILILFAHPALEKSRVNRVLIESISDLAGVTFHDLYEAYPNFDIDVKREQQLLVDNDLIVFQHPFFWYSTPSMLKEWQDLVLEHGWAYGTGCDALRGKLAMNALTAGGRESTYQPGGLAGLTVSNLLNPMRYTARLCGMDYLSPFIAHGTHAMKPDEFKSHARDYRRLIEAFRDGAVDIEATRGLDRINLNLDKIITSGGGT